MIESLLRSRVAAILQLRSTACSHNRGPLSNTRRPASADSCILLSKLQTGSNTACGVRSIRSAGGRCMADVSPRWNRCLATSATTRGWIASRCAGRSKVDTQWKLFCLRHNIEQLAHHGVARWGERDRKALSWHEARRVPWNDGFGVTGNTGSATNLLE